MLEFFTGSDACFSDNHTKLVLWHLGQVGPTKFDSVKKVKKLFYGNDLSFWSYLARMRLKFCLGTENPASGPA